MLFPFLNAFFSILNFRLTSLNLVFQQKCFFFFGSPCKVCVTKSYEYVCMVGYTEFGEKQKMKNKILSGIYNKSFFLLRVISARSPPPPPNFFQTVSKLLKVLFLSLFSVVVFQFFSLRACKEQNGVSLYVVIS